MFNLGLNILIRINGGRPVKWAAGVVRKTFNNYALHIRDVAIMLDCSQFIYENNICQMSFNIICIETLGEVNY